MKSGQRKDPLVKCPFYNKEEGLKIFCEGVQEGTVVHLAFDARPDLKEYKNRFCKGCYNGCLLAGMLNRKWGYDAN